jgi:hypothetical protein
MVRLYRLVIFLIFLILIIGSGCATDRKAREIIKRADSSCDLSHLGKNKFYYSPSYKRHLKNNIRQINHKKTSGMKRIKIRF